MGTYLQQHLRYPTEALEAKIEGTVHVRYDIDHKGKVVSTQVLSGIGHGCDEEAERLVRGLEFTIPKKARGIRILYHKNLKVNFHLPQAKPTAPPAAGQLTYTVTPSTGTERSYSYQITLPEQ